MSTSLTDLTKMKILATLIVGVALLGVAATENDQPELVNLEEQPISEINEGKRGETPEVVLQLKYDNGELNKIYLAQFRKPNPTWVPSVGAQTTLCADLCHAGLGGSPCGPTCPKLIPVGLRPYLQQANVTEPRYGEPRVEVCPVLCKNDLGEPLCKCQPNEVINNTDMIEWDAICDAFCADGYVLAGCAPCKAGTRVPAAVTSSRVLNTVAGWTAWCDVQCRQGHGGAACNCDRNPFL